VTREGVENRNEFNQSKDGSFYFHVDVRLPKMRVNQGTSQGLSKLW